MAGNEIVINPIQLGLVDIVVRGTSPLICHRYTDEVAQDIEGDQTGRAAKPKGFRDPEAEAKASLYERADGSYGFPAIAFKKAMVRAAKQTDMTMTDARGFFHVMGDLLPIESKGGWRMRRDRTVIGRGTLMNRYRPMFEDWEITLPIQFNMALISAEQLFQLVELAGFSVGIGDWRPEKDGQFGMFEVKRG